MGWRRVLQEDVAHLNLPMELTNPWVWRNGFHSGPRPVNIQKRERFWWRAFNLHFQKMRNHFSFFSFFTYVFPRFLLNLLVELGAVKYIVLGVVLFVDTRIESLFY